MALRSTAGHRKGKGAAASSSAALVHVARAVAAFRAGRPVAISGSAGVLALAVETAPDRALKTLLAGRKPAVLVLTHARARTLKIRVYTPDVVALPLPRDAQMAKLRAIADPTKDLAEPMKGPFEPVRGRISENLALAVRLAKLSGLLPAVVAAQGASAPNNAARIRAKDIAAYDEESARTLSIVTRASVPLEGAEQAELVAFRSGVVGPEHYAVVINAPSAQKPVLTRLHSECFTGDLLGSLKCDCGAQLRGAIRTISKAGGGVLLYLAQEGRGIGLVNKLRAYRLQDQGFDTMEANERLGFEPDERLYAIAAKMLKLLGYRSVRLLTNNPAKIGALKSRGIRVAERVAHAFPDNPHNRHYLQAKARAGHLL